PISVVLSGNKGARSVVESTAVLRDVAVVSGGLLTVNGSSGTDTINLTRNTDGKIHAVVNGKDKKFTASSVSRVAVYAFPGDDHVTLAASGVPGAYIDGSEGNDVLSGGGGADNIIGGAGKNTIMGNDGDDRLVGSGGRDFIYGGAGNDRIYGL